MNSPAPAAAAAPATLDPDEALFEARVEGMHCAGCVLSIEKAVGRVPGVEEVSVSLTTGDLAVRLSSPARALPPERGFLREEIGRALAGAGPYRLSPVGAGAPATADSAAVPERSATDADAPEPATAAAGVIEVGEIGPGGDSASQPAAGFRPVAAALALAFSAMGVRMSALGDSPSGAWLQFLLATPVVGFYGLPFVRGLGLALRRGVFGMDSLIGLGAGTAYAASVVALFRPGGTLFFDTAALVVAIVCLGRFFETRAQGRASEALAGLFALTPRTATVLRGGAETAAPVDTVAVGDHLRVRPGERVPLDGRIIRGGATLDESAITGESVPVERAVSDPVRAGALNRSGFFDLEVTRPAAESTLARIAAAVRRAQAEKIPLQRAADRVAGVFVPIVMVLAALSTAVWLLAGADAGFAIARAVAVLVVACPCAIGLAAPIAVLVATGRSARDGILFRNGAALEGLSTVRAVGLDKTGTLTTGEPAVAVVEPAPGVRPGELLRLAASAEQGSEHPLGAALLAHARGRGIPLTPLRRFEALPGRGVSAELETGEQVLVGSVRLAREHGAWPPGEPGPTASGPNSAAAAPTEPTRSTTAATTSTTTSTMSGAGTEPGPGRLLAVVVDEAGRGELLGGVGFRDSLRPEAAEAVRRLAEDGLPVTLLSGDSPEAVAAAGEAAGIPATVGGLLPEDKLAALDRLRERHGAVAMVGDGINDAPALARAEVGVAFAAGAEVAREAAPVTLIRPDLRLVSAAVRLSRRAVRIIRQNLFWAFAYNTAAIPLAAGVFYPATGALLSPEVAAAAMALSSISVVGNALRLRRPVP